MLNTFAPTATLVGGSPLSGVDALDATAPPADLWVRGLTKRFDAATPVLDGVAFQVKAGQRVALIGANGAGKSTLLRCCMHLIPPDGGEVRLFGTPLAGLDAQALRRLRAQVGFVFQKHNLVPRLSALSNVLHGALPRSPLAQAWFQGLAPAALRSEALACLDRVGLSHIALRRADRLSGGQSQRVAVARALMQRPRLIVADEPAASLDPVAGDEVMALFSGLVKDEGLTMVFTSHDLVHAVKYADRVIALQRGRIVLDALSHTVSVAELRSLYE
ncbi:phosphonate ABC transporter ATP-binding protein [Hydrogenophaga sp.]|jgi:phosphonate transport system ATP-binding protein|uniref:phosphonate ABC transporter ATP-binding protein n=1 Tax=Hydrogenophaga sp. TaxID=1904254 RepID=UPI002733A9E3|nr:ATP-binding cassette domain-containing protein [Hydrogenophaga sp.]MDP3887907.1 ATP-binding cassette domain-containing protein [Hydrogenophaga sp.]